MIYEHNINANIIPTHDDRPKLAFKAKSIKTIITLTLPAPTINKVLTIITLKPLPIVIHQPTIASISCIITKNNIAYSQTLITDTISVDIA